MKNGYSPNLLVLYQFSLYCCRRKSSLKYNKIDQTRFLPTQIITRLPHDVAVGSQDRSSRKRVCGSQVAEESHRQKINQTDRNNREKQKRKQSTENLVDIDHCSSISTKQNRPTVHEID